MHMLLPPLAAIQIDQAWFYVIATASGYAPLLVYVRYLIDKQTKLYEQQMQRQEAQIAKIEKERDEANARAWRALEGMDRSVGVAGKVVDVIGASSSTAGEP